MAQVMPAASHGNNSPFSSGSLDSLDRSTPTPQPPRLFVPPSQYARSAPASDWSRSSSAPSSPRGYAGDLSRSSSFHSTPPSSLSLNAQYCQDNDDDDDAFMLPSYDQEQPAGGVVQDSHSHASSQHPTSAQADSSETSTSDGTDADSSYAVQRVADDTEVKEEPTQQVDYLSHEWQEDDIHSSWKYIVSNRRVYGERSRLENASWRTWAKSKYNLQTVAPSKLNWLKDCDVTWLYGPLSQSHHVSQLSDPSSRLSKRNSFIQGANKKSNLKKRSVSEVMLQKSISTSSLVKQAAAAVQAQRRHSSRSSYSRSAVDFSSTLPSASTTTADYTDTVASSSTSGVQSPSGGRKHIRFDTNVEQCMAVEFKPTGEDQSYAQTKEWEQACDSPDSSDNDMPMIKAKSRPIQNLSRTSSSRNSVCSESRGITKLPSTTIRFHADEAEAQERARQHTILGWARSPTEHSLDKSPSQETLRPARPYSAPTDDDGDDDLMDWEATVPYGHNRANRASSTTLGPVETAEESRDGMRRTNSGMFMPFENLEEDDEALVGNGIFGRVVDTVNTARDIAHLVWNVGWRN